MKYVNGFQLYHLSGETIFLHLQLLQALPEITDCIKTEEIGNKQVYNRFLGLTGVLI